MAEASETIREFFDAYAKATGSLDSAFLGSAYGDTFMFAGPGGVQAVKRDDFLDPMPSKRGGVDFETVAPNGHIYTIFYLNIMARKNSPSAHDNLGQELGLVEAAGFKIKLPIH